jgi:clan AA aspartic protease (TIGR02281 family)
MRLAYMLGVVLMLGASVRADTIPLTSAAEDLKSTVHTEENRTDRMTVPVYINGAGPFQFIIDTGASRTVISAELAARLGLKAGKSAVMHTMNGIDKVPTVLIERLQMSNAVVTNIAAPSLQARNLGADGLLGIDSLHDQEIVIDFRSQTMTVSASVKGPAPKDEPGTIVVTARSRFGQLILVDADINERKINVVLDTGAQNSVGNSALRKLVARDRSKQIVPIELVGVTGDHTAADYTQIDLVRIGGMSVTHAPTAFADAHPFAQFGLSHKPSMLLGMDILRKFDRIAIDFGKRKIRFLLPKEAQRVTRPFLTSGEPGSGDLQSGGL